MLKNKMIFAIKRSQSDQFDQQKFGDIVKLISYLMNFQNKYECGTIRSNTRLISHEPKYDEYFALTDRTLDAKGKITKSNMLSSRSGVACLEYQVYAILADQNRVPLTSFDKFVKVSA